MPRPIRIEYEDAYYHVMNRSRDGARQPLFHDDAYFMAFLNTLAEAQARFMIVIGRKGQSQRFQRVHAGGLRSTHVGIQNCVKTLSLFRIKMLCGEPASRSVLGTQRETQ